MVGAFCSMFVLTEALGQDGPINEPVTLVVVLFIDFAVTMLVLGALGTAIERFAYRPLRNARADRHVTEHHPDHLRAVALNTPQVIDPVPARDLGVSVGGQPVRTPRGILMIASRVRQPGKDRPNDRSTAQDRRQPSSRASTSTARSRSRSSSVGARGRSCRASTGNIQFTLGFRRAEGLHRGRSRRHRQHHRAALGGF
jgi:hypothetical protein